MKMAKSDEDRVLIHKDKFIQAAARWTAPILAGSHRESRDPRRVTAE